MAVRCPLETVARGRFRSQRDRGIEQVGDLSQRAIGELQLSDTVIGIRHRLVRALMFASNPLAIDRPAGSSAHY